MEPQNEGGREHAIIFNGGCEAVFSEAEGSVWPVDKPLRWTSFDVVNKLKFEIRRQTGLKKFKIGHAGTLDPLADGLLLVCLGRATKRIEELQSMPKTYTGTFVLGATTASYDLEQPVEQPRPYAHITLEQLREACAALTGPLQQVPPLFSAVKLEGKSAFKYARKGEEPPLPENHPLLHAPNVVMAPHVGYATREAFDSRIDIVFSYLKDYLKEAVNA